MQKIREQEKLLTSFFCAEKLTLEAMLDIVADAANMFRQALKVCLSCSMSDFVSFVRLGTHSFNFSWRTLFNFGALSRRLKNGSRAVGELEPLLAESRRSAPVMVTFLVLPPVYCLQLHK